MAELDKKTIQTLTELSRIGCTEEEQEHLLADLKSILGYVEQLAEVETGDVPPCNHVLADMNNVTREDVVGETLPRELFLENAPEQIGGLIRVPTVIKNRGN